MLIEQLEQALLTNRIIALAMGMLMERHTIDSSAAWDRLREHSNRSNIPVTQLAQTMIQDVER
ncbi:ANTAR domain-containing protein [Klenkia sp. PcliD-1-E]|uniref:ANTAR domain-containing protein n=1 Tax=Klenkia sp. PcliD-1-E TaxID=2954492 RepID=UPI0020975607|nr:ANTAR domain-containing protein [Klenkia sp. PcliD-1-E]MCO7218330.1 ANTAR domain-containing protein [Klenkia sp. PcliD-1-E]